MYIYVDVDTGGETEGSQRLFSLQATSQAGK